ncbi:MAG: TIGR01458 family HAD-type hydrolase, partial [Mariprofundaceae bacterium]
MFTEQNIRAVLLDLDGVLYVGDRMIDAADTSINRLGERGLKLAGLTNTTTQSRRMIADKLAGLGIDLAEDKLYTPAALAVQCIGRHPARLYIRDALREDFSDVHEDEAHPEFIVMGDIGGEGYPPDILRDIFLQLMEGAELLALHKNRFWQKPDGLHLDLGTFVAAIEYASGKQA